MREHRASGHYSPSPTTGQPGDLLALGVPRQSISFGEHVEFRLEDPTLDGSLRLAWAEAIFPGWPMTSSHHSDDD
jgi:hypothetical protein